MTPDVLVSDPLAHVVFAPAAPQARTDHRSRAQHAVRARRQCLRPVRPGAEPSADELLLWILRRTSVPAEAYRSQALERRLGACLRMLRVSSAEQARKILEQRPELLPAALSTILLGVTGFFRDEMVFQWLAAHGLPQLAARRRPLRIWSAGCSDGQELYSVAMLLAEQSLLDGSDLLGTDCRADAIARARAGLYPCSALQGLDRCRRMRWFAGTGSQVRVALALRDAARWQVADLLSDAAATGPWDLILCRNLAIYLNCDSASRLWERLASSLAAGGMLVTGKAERPSDSLPLARLAGVVYRKTEG